MKNKKLTGVAVPLGALYTKDNPVIGEFPDLKPFADYCQAAGISIIQLLPVNDTGTQSSPYSGLSAFALHPIYIRLKDVPGFDELYKNDEKFKKAYDVFVANQKYTLRYNYDAILNTKTALLKMLYDSTDEGKTGDAGEALSKWIKANSWVKDYAVYKNLKWNYMQASWKSWLESDRNKTKEEITALWNKKAFKKEHLFYAWTQMVADAQFRDAVDYVKAAGLMLKGDMPILMNEDSCDAWAYPEVFNQELRAGAPADGDNPNGQNWGFPTYNWKNLKDDDYSWWKARLTNASKYYDAYRLDHILGFFRIWAIPEADLNALNGHTEPYAFIKRSELYDLGFNDDRIRWLSQPHIPTGVIEDITWNHDKAHQILAIFCDKIDGEELWRFSPALKGNKAIEEADLTELCAPEAIGRVKKVLEDYWSNRTLIEIAKNKFVPLWTYGKSTSWGTLNDQEKGALLNCFNELNEKNEKLWKKQADEIFAAITKSVKMIPCGEDLGVNTECVPKTMDAHKILGLRVVRWCRKWSEPGQPYVPFSEYTPLSVTTTSVHDSSTVRQWWDEEKDSVRAFVSANPEALGIKENELMDMTQAISAQPFNAQVAQSILKASAAAASVWFIPPLQDFLYMDEKLWLDKAADERINVPGTVTEFNWTYRLPVSLEELSENVELTGKIKKISSR